MRRSQGLRCPRQVGYLDTKRMAMKNDAWRGCVVRMMKTGLGYEDIAVKLKCKAEDVRREAKILKEEGELDDLYRARK